MASTAAGRVVVGAPATSGSISSEIVAPPSGVSRVQVVVSAHRREVGCCWGQPRLVASSSFFGAGVERFALRASNVGRVVAGIKAVVVCLEFWFVLYWCSFRMCGVGSMFWVWFLRCICHSGALVFLTVCFWRSAGIRATDRC